MQNLAELDQRISGLADRMRSLQAGRDRRFRLALEMLARIEQRVRDQHAALEEANRRAVQAEQERDAAIARAGELIELYEGSVSNFDAFFGGIESLAQRIVGDVPARRSAPEATQPASRNIPEMRAPAPSPASRAAASSGLVQAPSKTPFLGELGPARVQPRPQPDGKAAGAMPLDPARPKPG